MSNVLRRSRDPQYLHLYKKCIISYRTAMIDLAYCRYAECCWNMYEVLEFFWKSIHFLQSGRYPTRHLPNLQDFILISAFLQNYIQPTTIARIRAIYQRCNPGWQRNPQQRTRPRYGDEQSGIPPSRLYSSKAAERALRYSSLLARELVGIHRTIMLRHSELLVGILSGTFTHSRHEIKCNQAPYATGCNISKWRSYLSQTPGLKPRLKTVSEMDNSLCCVINPFGEAYPEKTSAPSTLPAYELIRDYVFFGGVFICCGGMPFTYYFDVTLGGGLRNTSTVLPNYPVAFRFVTVQGAPQIQILGTTLLINNLIQRDFGLMTLMDDPTLGRVGPFSSQIYQNANDKQFWNCSKTGSTLNVFRPIDPINSHNAVPVVRAQVSGNEVYPVAFIKHGFGILLHIGLDLSSSRHNERDFAKEAIRALLQNYPSYFR